ncbi:MAG: hypothetical protein R3A48_20210 [Polyangiales bacterium]
MLGCKVYDESLLLRRDAAPAELQDVGPSLDLVANDVADAPDASRMDVADASGPDVADVSAADLVDAPAPPPDLVVAADVVDVPPPDVPPSCDDVLRAGNACIEPLTGHLWPADDPRLVAPRALSFASNRVLVSDVGSGRVLGYDLALGARASVILGSGVVGATPPSGADTSAPLGAVVAMAPLPGGALALADATTRQVLLAAGGRVDALPMLAFQRAPAGLAWDSAGRALYVSADNRILRVPFDADAGAGAPEAVVGLPCGTNCPSSFNGDGLPGVATALNNPAGVDLDATHVYFADRDNCRVRRFRRDDPDRVVTTYAGSVCDEVNDPFVGLSTFATPTQLRLGRVSDVRVGSDGSVYFIDASRCAIFGITPARMMGGDPIPRVVAGSADGCGRVANSGPPLGPLGGLGVSGDRSAVFFVDLRGQRVGRIVGTSNGGSPSLDFPIAPGTIPATSDALGTARLGEPNGLALSDDGSSVFVTGSAEGRVYELVGGSLRALTGDGASAPNERDLSVSLAALPPTAFSGLSRSTSRTLVSLAPLGAVTELRDGALHRVAGRFPSALSAPPPLDGGVGDASADASLAADALDVTDGGPPTALERQFALPAQALATPSGVIFGDANGRVWRVSPTGETTNFAGAGSLVTGMVPPPGGTGVAATIAAIGSVRGLAVDGTGRTFISDGARNVVWSVGLESPPRARIVVGSIDRRAPLSDAPAFGPDFVLASPAGLAFDGGTTLYIADTDANRVLSLNVLSGQVSVVAGSGPATSITPAGDFGAARAATLSRPAAVAYLNRRIYIAEAGSGRVRIVRLP